EVIPFHVRDRTGKDLALCERLAEWGRRIFGANVHELREKFYLDVLKKRAGKKTGLAKILKAVGDADDWAALLGELARLAHDGRDLRQRPGPQVVAVRKAPGKNHDIRRLQVVLGMPHRLHVLAQQILIQMDDVVIAVRTGKYDYRDAFHAALIS